MDLDNILSFQILNVVSGPPAYIDGEIGEDRCPDGYEVITDADECKNASRKLGFKYFEDQLTTGAHSICNWCGGCSPKGARLSDSHGHLARWICRREGI